MNITLALQILSILAVIFIAARFYMADDENDEHENGNSWGRL